MRQFYISRIIVGVIYRPSAEPELPNIPVPTLVIHGEEDQVIPVQAGRELANAINRAEFHSLPEAGHSATIERPEAVTEILDQFLHKQQSVSSTV